MTKNKNSERALMLAFLLSGQQSPASDEDLANERFVEPGKAIEVHWRIDCRKTGAEVSTLLATLTDQRQADCESFLGVKHSDELGNLLDSLQKCGFIYNIPGSRRFQPCPDYALAHRGLANVNDSCHHSVGKADSRPGLLRQTQAALNCSQAP